CALLQKIIGAGRPRVERTAGNGKYFSALLAGESRRDQGAGTLGRLNHHDAERDSRDKPVAAREVLAARRKAGRPLADEQSLLANGALKLFILGRVDDVDAARQHSNGAAFERSCVRRRVNAPGETRSDHETFEPKICGERTCE